MSEPIKIETGKQHLPKTLFIDIDGTILHHQGNISDIWMRGADVLAGTRKRFDEWHSRGYKIILVTGRPETIREVTHKQLMDAGLIYDMLIMGVGIGARILINDLHPNYPGDTAVAINVPRNSGLGHIEIVK